MKSSLHPRLPGRLKHGFERLATDLFNLLDTFLVSFVPFKAIHVCSKLGILLAIDLPFASDEREAHEDISSGDFCTAKILASVW